MVNDYIKIDIGNVRGIQGEKGERGERGYTPSYDDLKYQKQNDEFITLKTNEPINISDYYLDAEGNLCNSKGYLYNENKELTTEKGTPFDKTTYGYEYYRLWIDADGKFTNEKGEILDEKGNPQYVKSSIINDIVAYIYEDKEAYDKIVHDIYPEIVKTLINADPTSDEYKSFFDAIEGDIKYYICEDNPKNSIILVNGIVENTCKYYDENGVLVTDTPVPLEKNALYLYKNNNVDDDNSVMHYDIYLCLESGTVPKSLVSSSDFVHNYNVIDDIGVKVEPSSNGLEDEKDVILKLYTRGTRGQFYSMSDVDKIIMDNLINKLGTVNGIAQLNNSGKVPSSQLPSFVDDVIEGTMNNNETIFTPSNNEYIDSVRESGKIYVDTNKRKTYRWSGSEYIYISNPVVVDDGTENAYASSKGQALETKIGTSSLNTTEQTIIGAINEHETDINTINLNKQDKTDNNLNTTNKTVTGALNELNNIVLNNYYTKSDIDDLIGTIDIWLTS